MQLRLLAPSAVGAAGLRACARRGIGTLSDRRLPATACARHAGRGACQRALLDFACALAQPCFINEYVFAETESETVQVATLRDAARGRLSTGRRSPPLSRRRRRGCYTPLHALAQAGALLQRSWPAPLEAVIAQQVREPRPSARSALDPGADRDRGRSLAQSSRPIRGMPYPRWVKTSAGRTADRRRLVPAQPVAGSPDPPVPDRRSLDVLIAGCGTGQHAIETAQRFAGARVLAIDLSRTSLGYALRKTRERVSQCPVRAGRHP